MVELQLGTKEEEISQVLEDLRQAIAIATSRPVTKIVVGHQRYWDLSSSSSSSSSSKTTQPESSEFFRLLQELTVLQVASLQRIDCQFEFLLVTDKDERNYTKQKRRLQDLTQRLAKDLQRHLDDESIQLSLDGYSNRIEEPRQHTVTGCASIIFSRSNTTG